MKVKVVTLFQDKYTKEVYNPGSVIEIEDEARIEDLKNRGLAEPIEEKKPVGITVFEKEVEKKALVDALKGIGAQVTGTMGEKTLLDKVAGLDEEATVKLKEVLSV